jgi:hypothetical protein
MVITAVLLAVLSVAMLGEVIYIIEKTYSLRSKQSCSPGWLLLSDAAPSRAMGMDAKPNEPEAARVYGGLKPA